MNKEALKAVGLFWLGITLCTAAAGAFMVSAIFISKSCGPIYGLLFFVTPALLALSYVIYSTALADIKKGPYE